MEFKNISTVSLGNPGFHRWHWAEMYFRVGNFFCMSTIVCVDINFDHFSSRCKFQVFDLTLMVTLSWQAHKINSCCPRKQELLSDTRKYKYKQGQNFLKQETREKWWKTFSISYRERKRQKFMSVCPKVRLLSSWWQRWYLWLFEGFSFLITNFVALVAQTFSASIRFIMMENFRDLGQKSFLGNSKVSSSLIPKSPRNRDKNVDFSNFLFQFELSYKKLSLILENFYARVWFLQEMYYIFRHWRFEKSRKKSFQNCENIKI